MVRWRYAPNVQNTTYFFTMTRTVNHRDRRDTVYISVLSHRICENHISGDLDPWSGPSRLHLLACTRPLWAVQRAVDECISRREGWQDGSCRHCGLKKLSSDTITSRSGASNPSLWVGDQPITSDIVKHTTFHANIWRSKRNKSVKIIVVPYVLNV